MQIEPLLSAHWQLQVQQEQIKPCGPVWRIRTKEADYCLKRGKHGSSRLLFDYYAIESLWNKEYGGTPRFIPTSFGKPFAETPDGPFALTLWTGRTLDSSQSAEWMGAAEELARFHLAGQKLELPSGLKQVKFKGKWLKRLAERTAELEQMLAALDSRTNEFEAKVLDIAPFLLHQAKQAAEMLEQSCYEKLVHQLEEQPTLVHGNVKAENFTVAADGRICLIDFDSFRIDLTVQDVSDFFANAFPALDWSLPLCCDLFEAYYAQRQLLAEEVPILISLLLFPHQAYTALFKYVHTDRPLPKSLRKWQSAEQQMLKNREFLPKWASWLQNRVQ